MLFISKHVYYSSSTPVVAHKITISNPSSMKLKWLVFIVSPALFLRQHKCSLKNLHDWHPCLCKWFLAINWWTVELRWYLKTQWALGLAVWLKFETVETISGGVSCDNACSFPASLKRLSCRLNCNCIVVLFGQIDTVNVIWDSENCKMWFICCGQKVFEHVHNFLANHSHTFLTLIVIGKWHKFFYLKRTCVDVVWEMLFTALLLLFDFVSTEVDDWCCFG